MCFSLLSDVQCRYEFIWFPNFSRIQSIRKCSKICKSSQNMFLKLQNSDIINLLWNIKNDVESEESQSGYYKIKDEVEKLMNDIISNKEETMIYLFNNVR